MSQSLELHVFIGKCQQYVRFPYIIYLRSSDADIQFKALETFAFPIECASSFPVKKILSFRP